MAIIERECCISSRNALYNTTSLNVINRLMKEESETIDVALFDSNLTTSHQK